MRKLLGIIVTIGILALSILPALVPQPVMADSTTVYANKDTYLSEFYPGTKYGSQYDMRVGGRGANRHRAIVGFGLPTLPDNAEITSAELGLYYKSQDGYAVGRFIKAFGLTSGRSLYWSESVADWTYYGSLMGQTWGTAGCGSSSTDYTTTGAATAVVPDIYKYMTWDVTTIIENAYSAGYMAQSFRISDEYEDANASAYFWAREYGSRQPYLTITYTVPDPVVAPTVSTSSATSIGETSATLGGSLSSDGGESCSVRFNYGTSTAYGSNTAWQSGKVSGNTFSATISGLAAGTTYYFRAQASNSAGTTSATGLSFSTKPYQVANFAATAGNGEVDLTWTKGAGADKTMIRRSTSSYPSSPTSGTQVYYDTGTSHTDAGLSNGTTYYYSAWSWANATYSTNRATDWATPTAPAAPSCTTNAATAVTADGAQLNMYLDSLGGAASANVSFEYYKHGEAAWGESTPAVEYTTTGVHYVTIAALDATTVYYFRAKAVSVHGTGYGSSMSFTTGGLSAPTMVTQAATGVMRTEATMRGLVDDDGGDPYGVTAWFEWGLSEHSLTNETSAQLGLTTGDMPYTGLLGLTSGTTYFYRILGQNSEGVAYGATYNFTTSTAPAPTVRTDPAVPGGNQATLYGTVLTDGGAPVSIRFQYGPTNAYGTNTTWLSGYSAGQSFSVLITGLDTVTTYHFRAQAMNEGGTASGSGLNFTTVFAAPGNFQARAISHSLIKLDWTKGGDQTLVRYKEGSYPVDRDDGTQCYFGSGTSTSVSNLEAGTTYYFRAWSWREGNVWAEDYASDVATTLSGLLPGEADPDPTIVAPDPPSSWFAMPTGKGLANMPLYDEVLTLADSMSIPHGTWWFAGAIGLMLLIGGLIWKVTRKPIIAIIVAAFVVVICTYLTMMPLWFLLMYLVFAGGVTYVSVRM